MIHKSVEIPRACARGPLRLRWADVGLLISYAAGFWLAHWMAAYWGGQGFYSVWFPAAGLRLALLWHAGPRLTPAIAVIEILINLAKGVLSFASPDWEITLWGIVRPVIAYGATVAAIRWLASGKRAGIMNPPMPFGLAAVAAPIMAALTALPESLLRPDMTHVGSMREVITSLIAFSVGDLLGVLIVAPPLLWLADVLPRPQKSLRATIASTAIPWAAVTEVATTLIGAVIATRLLSRIGLGPQPTPVILAVAWIGLRFGRFAVWIALAVVTALLLPETAGDMSTTARLQFHLDLATVVVVGYLAGTYCDAQKRSRSDVQRRDRLLFQAERLKTLRAMSVAVIHEISQPLSTLAIEAKHLHDITAESDSEIAQSAALIDRKAATLSNLVRRLRRFGGAAVDEPSQLPVSALIDSVVAIVAPEAKSEGVIVEVHPIDPDLIILAQEVELSQAVMNLMRNAIQASSDKRVELRAHQIGEKVKLAIANQYLVSGASKTGMGVGTLVAQAIVEAHGGSLVRETSSRGLVIASITLPLAGAIS